MNSGIYQILNTRTGRVYIGSSKNVSKRFREHLKALQNGKHINTHLQSSFNKHGEDAFEFKVIEYTTDLFEREAYYIAEYDLLYNMGSVGGGDNLTNHPNREDIIKRITKSCKTAYANASDEFKKNNKLRNSGESNPNYGKSHSEATRQRMSNKRKQFFKDNPDAIISLRKGMEHYWNSLDSDKYAEICKSRSDRMLESNPFKGAKHSEETRQFLSDKFKEKYSNMSSKDKYTLNPQIRLVEIEGVMFYGVSEAGRQLGVSPATIIYRIKSKSKKWKEYRYLN